MTECEKGRGVFDAANKMIVGKPQDEAYYEEYKEVIVKAVGNEKLPNGYNVNFGHSIPRCAQPVGEHCGGYEGEGKCSVW